LPRRRCPGAGRLDVPGIAIEGRRVDSRAHAINGSGRWELKDDGALCAKFNATLPGRLTDARSPDDGCWYFFRDGEKLMRSTSIEPQAPPQAEIVRIQ
jgi:hypothetical protein